MTKPNGGSPIAPGFVVYERADGQKGYDLQMALDSVGPGWHELIRALFKQIEHDKEYNEGREMSLDSVYLAQVKEKWGTLRLYFAGGGAYAEGFIHALESISASICEDCGAPGKTGGTGWIRTLCESCRSKRA